ncbi:immunoglobulin superfamily member 6 [Amblyraja radiata]|uniref:immunoglobulin superfamily member 6 n=1 Tax=Amblyraja radiata TaxID=386614 RepID=UPI001401D7BA|nr:immunoglobulin superfamily member 6 [Amblyraja radiata]
MGLGVRCTTPLSLLLLVMDLRTAGLVAATCVVAVQQKPLVVEQLASNVTITCNFTARHCSGQPQVTWYSIHGDRSRKLCVGECPDEVDGGRFQLQAPVGKGTANLRIGQVTGEDSGVYICTVAYNHTSALTARQAGNGTTLKVTDHGGIDLWLQSILIAVLSIYALCITINLLQTLKPSRKVDLQHRSSSSLVEESGSLALQAIAHELHSKFRKGSHSSLSPPQQHTAGPVDESIYQNV